MWEWLMKMVGAPPGRVSTGLVDSLATIAGRPDALLTQTPPAQSMMDAYYPGADNRVFGEYLEKGQHTWNGKDWIPRQADTIFIHPLNGLRNNQAPSTRDTYSNIDKPIIGHDVPPGYVYGHEVFHKYFAENPNEPIVQFFKQNYGRSTALDSNEWFARAAGDAVNLLRATARGNFADYGTALTEAFPGTAKLIDWMLTQPIWKDHPLNKGRNGME